LLTVAYRSLESFCSVHSFLVHTPAVYGFNSLWYSAVEQTSLRFKVRACSDVSIILAEHFSITDNGIYEILIGGSNNRKSSIRFGIQGIVLTEVDTLDLLHCSEARWFWIDWSKGIHVGSGAYVGDIFFLTLPVFDMPGVFPVSSVSIATGGTSDGDWEFTTSPGNVTVVKLTGILTL
jgi:hypothetical protein